MFKGIKHCLSAESWKALGLAPRTNPHELINGTVSLTPREMIALCRWDHMIYKRARYDCALGVSLASKGIVHIVGWIADEAERLGEMPPDWLLLTPAGPMDTRDGKIHAEIHALCELAPIGRNLLRHNLETMKCLTGSEGQRAQVFSVPKAALELLKSGRGQGS